MTSYIKQTFHFQSKHAQMTGFQQDDLAHDGFLAKLCPLDQTMTHPVAPGKGKGCLF